jgi:hypothetical protein
MDTVILTGSGGCVALGGLAPLRAAGFRVVGTDAEPTFSPGAYLCDDYRSVPRALKSERITGGRVEVEANPAWHDRIMELLDELSPAALLVNPDPEVLAIAGWHRDLPLLFPSGEQILASHDKRETQRILHAAGVDLPRAVDMGAFEAGCKAVLDAELKLFAKEQASAGGQNARVIETLEEAVVVRASQPGMLFYEFLPGDEFAVFLLYRDGELFVEGSFRKHQYKWGQGLRNETVDDDRLFALGDKAVRALAAAFDEKPHGTYHVDIRNTAGGEPKVLEINTARAFGGTPDAYVAFASEVNLPAIYVDLVRGETPKRQRVRGGIRQLQFHNYVFAEGDRSRRWDEMSPSR